VKDSATIERALQEGLERGAIPGVAAFAANGREILYAGAFGRRDLSRADAMTPDTVFWIASMTKAITTAAAMQLVERKLLTLDTPMGTILPELADPQVLEGFSEDGKPRLRPARRPVTLRYLLTHTAGFAYDMWSKEIDQYIAYAGLPRIISCRNAALQTPLLFDPGDDWCYGINIDFVGKAVEKLSGQSLEDYFRENIFAPLGMNDTRFILRPDMRSRLVRMHQRSESGVQPIDFEVPQQPEFFMGGGGLYGTGEDYIKFTQAILNGGIYNGERILKAETVAEMTKNQIDGLSMHVMKTAIPALSNDVDIFPGMEKKWGFGFMINTEDVPGARSAGSLGWAGLGNTYFWIDPKKRLTGVVLTQLLPFADAGVLNLLGAFEQAVYRALGPD